MKKKKTSIHHSLHNIVEVFFISHFQTLGNGLNSDRGSDQHLKDVVSDTLTFESFAFLFILYFTFRFLPYNLHLHIQFVPEFMDATQRYMRSLLSEIKCEIQ